MLTYQVRKRTFTVDDPSSIVFPNKVTATFVFEPLQPFGMTADGGRTAVIGKPANVKFNRNNGTYYIESLNPLEKLEVIAEHNNLTAKLEGNLFTISTQADSMDELSTLVNSFYYGFPLILNLEFADPPYIDQVYGTIGLIKFSWLLEKGNLPFVITDQERQEKKFVKSWLRIPFLNDGQNRRLLGALAYFHTACRLSRCGSSPWEFMSEVILNLSKVLEALFPSGPDGKTMDSSRDGLRSLGYSNDIIERKFIPAIALRNAIDVSHPFLSILKRHQLNMIHNYTENAEDNFRDLLNKIFQSLETGDYEVEEYDNILPDKDVIKLIDRLNR
jgi:hypothetical protein